MYITSADYGVRSGPYPLALPYFPHLYQRRYIIETMHSYTLPM